MHVLGKVFVWLIVIAAGAATVLSARLLQIRSGWTTKYAQVVEEVRRNEATLAEKQRQLEDLRRRVARVLLGWDRYWNDVRVTIANRAAGVVSAELGSNRGLGAGSAAGNAAAPVVVYAFQPNADGSSRFIGAFRVTQLRDDRSELTPLWRLRPGEVDTWQEGTWRIRSLVPSSYRAQLATLEVDLTVADELLEAKRRNLAMQTKLADQARRALAIREAELVGGNADVRDVQKKYAQQYADELGPDAAEKLFDPEEIRGYLAALEQAEERRNEVLAELDRLRRAVKQAHDEMERLRAGNLAHVASLPGATEAASETTAAVAGD